MFEFLKPKEKDKGKLYVVIETHYPEFIDNVKVCYTEEDTTRDEGGDISECEHIKPGEDVTKIIYVFKNQTNV